MQGHRPRKRFGQHFLHDRNLVEKMVRTIDPKPGQRLVEIGPGPGALTLALLDRVDHLDAVELDRDLIAELRRRIAPERLTLHQGDALKFDFRELADPGEKLRVVGNLPYNISTPLLFHLLDQAEVIKDMHFMLQKEVVDRLVAVPGTRDWGRLSVMIQYHCRAESLMRVPPGAFSPPPKVDSAVVRLIPREKPEHEARDYRHFARMVAQAFTQRRKAVRNSLKSFLAREAIEAAGVDPGLRPDQLSVADYVSLANNATSQDKGAL